MIFMSHNHKDKDFVEHISNKIAAIYGVENVFYDSWSIQPGDGIIDKMDIGLSNAKFFFFFVTKNSLASKMVGLEWQNALMRASANQLTFIPIKCDDSVMPALLTQNLYLDLYTTGIDVIIAQIKDIIDGKSTFKPKDEEFSNLSFDVKFDDKKLKVRITADYFSEVLADFIFVLNDKYTEADLRWHVPGEASIISGTAANHTLNDGNKCFALRIALHHGITPKIPVDVEISLVTGERPDLLAVMSKESATTYKSIPFKKKNDFSTFDFKF
ncbi:toll/interleukin-1 receptor domain-containing protein [Enterobacter kobei]|uniref:toll/interleukin-1 receptor domain-containing protein n=1 Tax=Enterobacter kobei TaxID=208224 RepID=UPI00205EEDD6|nr:MAG TPA: TIR domain [Caudoviricetes sp.]